MQNNSYPTAQRMWNAQLQVDQYKDQLCDLHNKILPDNWSDFTTDYYDESLEIFGVAKNIELSKDILKQLKWFGFCRVWTHTSGSKNDPNNIEKYYINDSYSAQYLDLVKNFHKTMERKMKELDNIVNLAQQATPGKWNACNKGDCTCGIITSKQFNAPIATATIGKWGDTYPAIRLKENTGSVEGIYEAYIEMIEYGEVSKEAGTNNAKYIAAASPETILKIAEYVHQLESIVQRAIILNEAVKQGEPDSKSRPPFVWIHGVKYTRKNYTDEREEFEAAVESILKENNNETVGAKE